MINPIKLFNNSGLLSLSSSNLLDFKFLNSTQYGTSLEIKLRAKYEDIKGYYYCKFGVHYYIIRDITITSKNICKIELETDNFLNYKLNLEYLWIWGGEEDE